ncbi:hypothetical protein OUZ56_027140 [Daphnia magna]|uniref:Uncharacterized protein n=1 Tax=Daphnia magna TaxID=35525 RepID=A0ABQ9ZNW0_9CRUS|nr:hypothetical protein OUZ56_027140 [Daphnia magna]
MFGHGKMLYNTRQSSLSWADENRTVNASELYELLKACLSNEDLKNCVDLDVYRHVLDGSGQGRWKLANFL